MKQSASFFGSSKSSDKAIELKRNGNTHYKNKRYHSAVKAYTKAMFYSPWPLPKVVRQLDDCIAELDLKFRSILYDDLTKVQDVTESYDSLPSLLAQCYGNRSAALYELGQHEGVVTDIDRALYAGYKKPQVFKLYKRKATSLAQLGRLAEARKVVEEYREGIDAEDSGLTPAEKEKCENDIVIINTEIMLSERKNVTPDEPKDDPVESFMSDSIKVQKSPKVGRHYVSMKEIPKGTCIVQEAPYACILDMEYAYTHCAYCFKECLTLIPCILCTNPGYCSYNCMYKSWRYHWIECKNAKEWSWMPWIAQMALRMLLLTPKNFLQSLIKEGRSSHSIDAAIEKAKKGFLVTPDKQLQVLSLVAHRGRYGDEEQRNLIEKEALRAVDYFKCHLIRYYELRECQSKTLYDLLRFHMCQLRCNTSTISINALTTLEDEGEGYNVRDVVKQKLGYSLFLAASLFNHSCEPNLFFRFEGNCVKVIAPNGAPAGVELNHCYGPQIGKQKKFRRQINLKKGFMFTCTCKACFNPDKDMIYKEHAWDALGCQKCGGVIPVLMDNYRTNCLKCGEVFPLREPLEKRDKARKLYTEAMEEKSLDKLLECEKIQKEVLFRSNLELARTRDNIAYFCVQEDTIEKAFDFLLSSFAAITNIFGIDSIESAEELNKLTQVLFKSGRITEAVETASDALPVLKLFYGPEHVDVLQLQSMIDTINLMNKKE